MTSYFERCSLGIAKYKNEDIPKIHLTAEEPPWVSSTTECYEREILMLNHQGQINIPASAASGPADVITLSPTHWLVMLLML